MNTISTKSSNFDSMGKNVEFRYTPAVVLVPMLALLMIWTVFLIEVRLGINLNEFGVYPRRLSGLQGVLFSPFIHGSVEHLYNNSIPLVVLLASVFYFYHSRAMKLLVLGILLSGLFTWLVGRPSYHIGASGVIYLLASFIFFKGIRSGHYRLVALSLLVVFLYGGLLWYIFPVEEGVSWEGHLGGFLAGAFLAFFLRGGTPKPPKYDWEREDYNEDDDPFLKHFDEDGNFIESTPDENEQVEVRYHYRKNDQDPS